MLKTALIAGLMAFAVATAPTLASAAGTIGGSQNRNANSYHCKSGHTVKNPKACKENGGHL